MPCRCHVTALHLPCRRDAPALLLPCRCHAPVPHCPPAAMSLPCPRPSAAISLSCYRPSLPCPRPPAAMSLPCRCHVPPFRCHVTEILPPPLFHVACHFSAMSLPFLVRQCRRALHRGPHPVEDRPTQNNVRHTGAPPKGKGGRKPPLTRCHVEVSSLACWKTDPPGDAAPKWAGACD